MKASLVLLLSALLPLAAQAQVGAPDPTATRSATRVAPPAVPAPQPVRPQSQPLPPAQPQQPAQPIKSTGPAQVAPTPAPALPDKVYDRNGRIVPGVKPVGPNRVFDSRTGRYYDSVPTGDGQQLKR